MRVLVIAINKKLYQSAQSERICIFESKLKSNLIHSAKVSGTDAFNWKLIFRSRHVTSTPFR